MLVLCVPSSFFFPFFSCLVFLLFISRCTLFFYSFSFFLLLLSLLFAVFVVFCPFIFVFNSRVLVQYVLSMFRIFFPFLFAIGAGPTIKHRISPHVITQERVPIGLQKAYHCNQPVTRTMPSQSVINYNVFLRFRINLKWNQAIFCGGTFLCNVFFPISF